MDILSINTQPDAGSIQAAYRPIYFNVSADALVGSDQPMYADVYFNSLYYKSFIANSIMDDGSGHSIFEFNIMDAAQEFINVYVPQIPTLAVIETSATAPFSEIKAVLVKFRGSTIVDGLLIPNPTIPIQGTATTPPYSGTGTASNIFSIVNASLVPDWKVDATGLNQLETVLDNNRLITVGEIISDTRVYGLTNCPLKPYTLNPDVSIAIDVYKDDHGIFPFVVIEFGTYMSVSRLSRSCTAHLRYFIAGVAYDTVTLTAPNPVTPGCWYIPSGLADIQHINPTLVALLTNVDNDAYYRVYLRDEDSGSVVVWSPLYHCKNTATERVRLWFQNMYGQFEQISFVRTSKVHKVTSGEQFRPYLETFTGIAPNDANAYQLTGRSRYNVRGQDEITLTTVVNEIMLPWLEELMRSGYAYIDTPDSGDSPHMMQSVKIEDATFTVLKSMIEGRYNYEFTVKIVPSLDYITLRN